MRDNLKDKKIWMSMFLSYMLIILICFILYSIIVIYETYAIGKERMEREQEVTVQEVEAAIERRLLAAQNIITNITSSSSIKKLYLSTLSGQEVDSVLTSYTLYTIQNDLSKIQVSSGRLDIDEVIVFLNDSSRAYTSNGVIDMESPYSEESLVMPAIMTNSIQNALSISANGRLTFIRESLLYADDYTYLTGASQGCVVVLFNLETLHNELTQILGENNGLLLLAGGTELLSIGHMTEPSLVVHSDMLRGVTVEVCFSSSILTKDILQALTLLLCFGTVLTISFIALAYSFSRKYYKPIEHIGRLVIEAPRSQDTNGMTDIIDGIRGLIGERNGYREKMITITPYAQQGMLHGVLSGKIQNDEVQVLSSKHYLDLQKPYFILSVVNIAQSKEIVADVFLQRIQEACDKVCRIFSADEYRIHTYRRDDDNLFLIINNDLGTEMDDLFFQIHKFFAETIDDPDCLITMGIDSVNEEDISQLHEACTRALHALDMMLIYGRGQVYFYENEERHSNLFYYFPKNSDRQLVKFLRERRLEDIRLFLENIHKKNISNAKFTTAAMHTLVDELHITTLKCIKELTELGTTHINIQKTEKSTTIDEAFRYYYAVFETIVTQLDIQTLQDGEDQALPDVILRFVDENFCIPQLSIQYIAEHFGVSCKYISLVFKKRLDTTYLQYLHHLRINRAMTLLESVAYTMEQVAEMCGYTNQLTFRRNFKSCTGVTPSEFRDNLDK